MPGRRAWSHLTIAYLDTGDPVFRRRVREDEREFEASKARYDRLSSGPTSDRLGRRVATLYAEVGRQVRPAPGAAPQRA